MDEPAALCEFFRRLGADAAQAATMARQLAKRADQVASERGIPREQALDELLRKIADGRSGRAPDDRGGRGS